MKWIFLLLLGIGCSAMATAQQKNKAQLPPVKTAGSASVQRTEKAELPIRKADNATQNKTSTPAIPIRKSDMSGSSAPGLVTNKTTTNNSKVQLPSDTPAPKKQADAQSGKQ